MEYGPMTHFEQADPTRTDPPVRLQDELTLEAVEQRFAGFSSNFVQGEA